MFSNFKKLNRREFLKLTGVGIAGTLLGGTAMPLIQRLKQPQADVTILKESSYSNNLVNSIRKGISNYPHVLQKVKGGRVVLKPNMVDHYPGHPINTDPAMIAGAISAFRQLGAREVVVAEGPGHNRDVEMLLSQTGIDGVLRDEKVKFIDLNLDSISPVKITSNYTGLSQFFFPHTILNADLVVSMPKLKTHHWAGATLSLKNLFGTIPGVKYGWPKNFLHWYGISESIADIASTIQPGFAIVDGIVGMEGDGPLHGTPIHSGVIVMGDNLTAVDSTAARIMGFYPEQIQHMSMMIPYGGTVNKALIQQLGEPLFTMPEKFKVLPHSTYVTKKPSLWEQALISGW